MALTQPDLQTQTREAIAQLQSASQQLEAAEGARDRIRALSETISAHEAGLAALRSGMRQVASREAVLAAKLQEKDAEIAALLTVLQRLGSNPSPVALLHPGGPTGSARAGMLLADVTPQLNQSAAALRDDLTELATLGRLQDSAVSQLQSGLMRLQKAREDLNRAIADRTPLPKRFVNDPVREAILIASAQTLSEFAAGLDRIAVDQIAEAPREIGEEKGALPLPVAGRVLRDTGEADAAGVTRPGVILSVLPGALVTAPVAATIRYTGPLLDYGQVVILEPRSDLLFVFAGLDTVYGSAGDVIDAGAPLGLTRGAGGKNIAVRSTDGELTGADLTERLYIEVRENNAPEDPNLWFRMDKDG